MRLSSARANGSNGHRRRRGLLAVRAALVVAAPLGFTHAVRADSLEVDSSDNNTPYTPSADATYDSITVGTSGTGELDQTNGVVLTVTGGVTLARDSSSAGTYNLSGGTLNTMNVSGGAGNSTFNFDGGILQAGGDSTAFLSNVSNAYVTANGATIDTQGFAVTIGQALVTAPGVGGAQDGGLTKNGTGTLTLTGPNTYTGLTIINAGTLAVNGSGSITGGGSIILNAGTTLAISGSGVVSTQDDLIIGNTAGAVATVTLADSGTLSAAQAFVGTAGVPGTISQSGGTTATFGELVVATGDSSSTGTYAITGGTVTASSFSVGDTGTGVVDQTAGTVTVINEGTLGLGSGTSANGTYNLSGGTLTTGTVTGGTGASTFNFNGGTLVAEYGSTTFLSGLTTANVQARGARIDTNGNDVTIGQPLVHDTTAGAPAIDGGLTKLGTGTLTLTAANTYTGGTIVSAGSVRVNNTTDSGTGTGAVTIGAGAALGGSGTIAGAVSVAAGATITAGPDDATIGTLHTGPQTWTGSATVMGVTTTPGTYFAKTDGSTADTLVMSGLTVAATQSNPFDINLSSNTGSTVTIAYPGRVVIADDTQTSNNPFSPGNSPATLAKLELTLTNVSASDSNSDLELATQSDGSGGYDLVVAAAPEPTSLLLLSAAVAPLGLGRRRRRC